MRMMSCQPLIIIAWERTRPSYLLTIVIELRKSGEVWSPGFSRPSVRVINARDHFDALAQCHVLPAEAGTPNLTALNSMAVLPSPLLHLEEREKPSHRSTEILADKLKVINHQLLSINHRDRSHGDLCQY